MSWLDSGILLTREEYWSIIYLCQFEQKDALSVVQPRLQNYGGGVFASAWKASRWNLKYHRCSGQQLVNVSLAGFIPQNVSCHYRSSSVSGTGNKTSSNPQIRKVSGGQLAWGSNTMPWWVSGKVLWGSGCGNFRCAAWKGAQALSLMDAQSFL